MPKPCGAGREVGVTRMSSKPSRRSTAKSSMPGESGAGVTVTKRNIPPFNGVTRRWFVRVERKMQDAWVGVYWDRAPLALDVWVCIVPMLPIHFGWIAQAFHDGPIGRG